MRGPTPVEALTRYQSAKRPELSHVLFITAIKVDHVARRAAPRRAAPTGTRIMLLLLRALCVDAQLTREQHVTADFNQLLKKEKVLKSSVLSFIMLCMLLDMSGVW